MSLRALLLLAALLPAAAKAASQGDGAALFKEQCADCHTVEAGRNKRGPSLAGIVGRKAGVQPNYNYSEALRQAGPTWTPQRLAQYLAAPKADIPGGKMRLLIPPRPEEITTIIEWLKQH